MCLRPNAHPWRAATLAVSLAISAIGSAQAQTTPPARPQGLSEGVAALVNGDIVSTYDLIQRMRLVIVTSGIQPTDDTLPQLQREALRSLIDERLQTQELRRVEKEQKIEIVASDKDIDEEIADIGRSNNMSGDQMLESLRAQGVDPQTFRAQLRASVSWQRWIQGRYGSRLRVGEDQVTAYQARLAAAASKPQYQISEVFLDAARLGGQDVALNGAEQLLAQIQQGAPFAAVARQFSAAPTAANGGDAGWVTAADLAPSVVEALEDLRPGQVSKPITVRNGVYIIQLRDKRAGAGAVVVDLKQAAIPLVESASATEVAAAMTKLQALRKRIAGCANLEAASSQVDGVIATDLGEAELSDLAPAFQQALQTLGTGQISAPIRTSAGLHVLAVCAKRQGGVTALTHDQIENRMIGQQLAMISKRYLRDLRTSAMIEAR